MSLRFISDIEADTQVDLPSGKITKKGVRTDLKAQTGMTCILYALRRIAFFNIDDVSNHQLQAYKKIKNALKIYNGNSEVLVTLAKEIFNDLSIDLNTAILSNETFTEQCYRVNRTRQKLISEIDIFNKLSHFTQWSVLYDILIEKVIKPLFNLEEANWHPQDGFEKLQECLRQKGALFFLGKFGSCFYSKKPIRSAETNNKRIVFYFEKNSYTGDALPFVHGVIVDQVKIISGRKMVFFRDPNTSSLQSKKEKVFMLSYETFVTRLTDMQGKRFSKNECSNNITFGLASNSPAKLYR